MTNRSSRRRRIQTIPRPNGYTMVELLVAITILGIIVLIMVSISNQASRAWIMGVSQNERRSNGRVLLDFVARDLKASMLPTKSLTPSSATAPPASLQFFANISTAPSATTNPTIIPAADLNPHAIFWQAPVAVNTTYGNVAEVGYFVRWDTTSKPGTALAQMCRFLVDPDAIDPTTGNTALTSNFLIYNRNTATTNPVNWLSVVDTMTPATAPSYQGWFADNVIAFWVRCLDSTGTPITKNAAGTAFPAYGFDSRQGYIDNNTPPITHPAPALPAAIDIAIVTVDSLTASRITTVLTATATTPANMATEIKTFMTGLPAPVQRGAQVFSTTVYLPTK